MYQTMNIGRALLDVSVKSSAQSKHSSFLVAALSLVFYFNICNFATFNERVINSLNSGDLVRSQLMSERVTNIKGRGPEGSTKLLPF